MPDAPHVDPDRIREGVLALEGTVIHDLTIPLPGDLKDISKAATIVSGIVEDRIPDLLNKVRSTTWDADNALDAYEFRKFPIGFPDILLVERANPENVLFEIEAKSWYALSGDKLTARFLTSKSVIGPGTLVIVVAWMLDGVVSGSPSMLRIHVDDAARLAHARDAAWSAIAPPESHRVVDPDNAVGTPRSLLRTQAVGEILRDGRYQADADNFGKLDRLYDNELNGFAETVSTIRAANRTLQEWRTFIKAGASRLTPPSTDTAAIADALRAAADLAEGLAGALDRPVPRRRAR